MSAIPTNCCYASPLVDAITVQIMGTKLPTQVTRVNTLVKVALKSDWMSKSSSRFCIALQVMEIAMDKEFNLDGVQRQSFLLLMESLLLIPAQLMLGSDCCNRVDTNECMI